MIEDAKATLRIWGAAEPNFLLCNSKLTFQMTMIPEKTQYLTQGPDGVRRLKEGPSINTYRGLKIINSRAFSMEDGAPPRDVLRRRVRVAEYYRIPWEEGVTDRYFSFYDESKDAWQKYSWHDLFGMAYIGELDDKQYENINGRFNFDDDYEDDDIYMNGGNAFMGKRFKSIPTKLRPSTVANNVDFKISKNAWNDMEEKEPHNASHEPAFELNDKGDMRDGEARYSNDQVLEVMKECGLMDVTDKGTHDLRKIDASEVDYLRSFFEYRRNFYNYVKSWLIGNVVPPKVHAFLERFNWQGFKNDGTLYTNRVKRFYDLLKHVYHDSKLDQKDFEEIKEDKWELVIIRPNIEHNMLGIVMGRGGLDELGATFWGQTELSCFDDSMHGICPKASASGIYLVQSVHKKQIADD